MGNSLHVEEYPLVASSIDKRYGLNIRCVREVDLPYVGETFWAETNLTAAGTFASRPDELTEFFQWSRNENYSATGNLPTVPWNTAAITATEWTPDPCPDHWRLPTQEELQKLISSGGTYGHRDDPAPYWKGNLVNGMFFGPRHADCMLPDDMKGCVFLPASGGRENNRGRLTYPNSSGYYWSSMQHGTTTTAAYGLTFDEMWSYSINNGDKKSGYNIRCVYDPKAVSASATQRMSTFSAAQADNYSIALKLYSVLDTCCTMSATAPPKLSLNADTTTITTEKPNAQSKATSANATLYPNPVTNGELTIDNGEVAIGEVAVLNGSGVVVRTQDFGSQTTGTLQLHGLHGMYYIRIGKTTQSIVVN